MFSEVAVKLAGKKILALSGGVGGAKLALGLSRLLKPEQLTVVCNTGDDFEHLGFPICPDLDTVMYTLAGINNREQGWGLAGETWQFMAALKQLGGEDWFLLGDKDLATHSQRRRLLAQGETLSRVTERLRQALGVSVSMVPMSDDRVSTQVHTLEFGTLPFQHYFVKERCQPTVVGFEFAGLASASPAPDFVQTLADPDLAAVVICPSNPFVSIDPMLSLPGIRQALKMLKAPVLAVSPIIGGKAIKGPAAKMLTELQMPCSAETVAAFYGDLLSGFVLDQEDAELVSAIESQCPVLCTATVMRSDEDKIRLAEEVLDFAVRLQERDYE